MMRKTTILILQATNQGNCSCDDLTITEIKKRKKLKRENESLSVAAQNTTISVTYPYINM